MSYVLTLTGMSTSGKSRLASRLSETGEFAEVVSVTTRARRPGEIEGVHYYFVTQDVFDQYLADGRLMEHVRSHSACYGVPSFGVADILRSGKSAVLVLEPDGVGAVRSAMQGMGIGFKSAFIEVDKDVLVTRFMERIRQEIAEKGEYSPEKEAARLKIMIDEECQWPESFSWDLRLNNLHLGGSFEQAVSDLLDIASSSVPPPTGSSEVLPRTPKGRFDTAFLEASIRDCIDGKTTPQRLSEVLFGAQKSKPKAERVATCELG